MEFVESLHPVVEVKPKMQNHESNHLNFRSTYA